MIRPRHLSEDTKKNLRHWGMELIVVVVGVLLALWAQAWFENRSDQLRVAEATQAIRDEVAYDVAVVEVLDALGACHDEQSQFIRRLLLDRDGAWSGIRRRAVRANPEDGEQYSSFYEGTLMQIRNEAWRAALESGAAEKMDDEIAQRFRSAFLSFEAVSEYKGRIHEARSRLLALTYPVRLSDDARLDALTEVGEIDFRNAAIRRSAIYQREEFAAFDFDERELRLIDKALDGWGEVVASWGELRPCYVPPRNPMRRSPTR